MKEAMLYERLDDARVRCGLCAHRCVIAEDGFGICGVRENLRGTLYSRVYGRAISLAADPIEKKPLFHFLPGSQAYSVATVGCNLRCAFCQNANISQMPRDQGRILGQRAPVEMVISGAERARCASIAYTYTEPTVFFEYTLDIARAARERGIASVYVTNGYMTGEMLDAMVDHEGRCLIDGANVDLKSFRDAFYRQHCGATLQPVLDSIVRMKTRGVWVEVTTLVIPGLNDSDEELTDIARFVAQEVGVDTPWHVSRFHPTYKMLDRPPTPVITVHRAREIGLAEGLQYVYVGNVPGSGGEDTVCPACGHTVIARMGFHVTRYEATGGHCAHCGATIAGYRL